MKQNKIFISIVAYGDINHVIKNLEINYHNNAEYLIHYNKRESIFKFWKLKKKLSKFKNVKVIRKFRIFWGHSSILKCHIFFMDFFLKKTNCNIFLSLDNNTYINLYDNIFNITNNDIFLNLSRSPECVYGDKYKNNFIKRVSENDNNYHMRKYRKLMEIKGKRKKVSKILAYIKVIIFNLFLNFVNFFSFCKGMLFSNEYKIELLKLDFMFSKKIFKYYDDLFSPFTIGSLFLFTRDNIIKMINDEDFKKIIKYAKNKHCPEEWAINNYWLKEKNADKKINDYIPMVYIHRDLKEEEIDKEKIKNFMFIRYSNKDIKKILE